MTTEQLFLSLLRRTRRPDSGLLDQQADDLLEVGRALGLEASQALALVQRGPAAAPGEDAPEPPDLRTAVVIQVAASGTRVPGWTSALDRLLKGPAPGESDAPPHLPPASDWGQPAPAEEPPAPDPLPEALQKEEAFRLQAVEKAESLGAHPPRLASALHDLAEFYQDHGRPQQAQPLFEQSVAIRTRTFGPDHVIVARSLLKYARLKQELGFEDEGRAMENRARALLDMAPEVAPSGTLKLRNQSAEAGPLMAALRPLMDADQVQISRGRAARDAILDPRTRTLKVELNRAWFTITRDEAALQSGPMQVIGSRIDPPGTWMWSWLNPQVPERARSGVEDFVRYAPPLVDLARLELFAIDEDTAELLADWIAIQSGGLAAHGMRRGPLTTYVILNPL